MKKPFNVLAEGLFIRGNRGDRRWAFPNESAGELLLQHALTYRFDFTADAIISTGTHAR